MKKAGEVLLFAIDQINDLDKAPILARIFAAFLRVEISSADLRRMTAAVNGATVDDLRSLAGLGPDPSGESGGHKDLVDALRHTGFTDSTAHSLVTSDAVDLREAITPLGKAFARAVGAGITT